LEDSVRQAICQVPCPLGTITGMEDGSNIDLSQFPARIRESGLDLGILMTFAHRTLTDQLIEHIDAREFGELRPMNGFVFVNCYPDGQTITALAYEAGVSKQAMMQVIDAMERRGLIEREPHPIDRRQKLVRLTAKGERAMRAVMRAWNDIEAEWVARIGAERMAALRQDLIAFVEMHQGWNIRALNRALSASEGKTP
jgi:DNA-binding MarR family transcriptional regulator